MKLSEVIKMLDTRKEIIEIKLITAVLETMNKELHRRLIKAKYETRKK